MRIVRERGPLSLLIKVDLGKVGGAALNAHQSIPHFPMHVNEGKAVSSPSALICAKHSKNELPS